jgi:hypothetical protein
MVVGFVAGYIEREEMKAKGKAVCVMNVKQAGSLSQIGPLFSLI